MKHLSLTLLCLCSAASAQGLLPRGVPNWHSGAEECTPETTRTEGFELDEHIFVFRQNPCVDYEANLVYLIRGSKRALLIDTGAVEGTAAQPLVEWVRQAIRTPDGATIPLLVVHTHGHQDHRAGDAAFAALANTEIASMPQGPIDLGDRGIQVIPAPGHHPDHVVFYDAQSQSLFTGDFLLQGRLLVDDLDAYRESAQRVADFVKAHPVEHVFGAHIELDVTGAPYEGGATYHPNERIRPLTVFDVDALPAALADFNGFYSTYPNFIVVNPIHNLIALAAGVVAVLVLLGWLTRWLWRRRRVSGTEPAR
jgi:hydroxyacylglutathione hydrolase